jgi:uncharacterized protein with ParB-like and HNH nuclease domain
MNRRPNTQDISWFLDLNSNSQLDLDPPYQRKSVWTRSDRQFFLDTIFRNFPCPAIFLHKEIDEQGRTIYHVVDGKQRLQTIISFVDNEISVAADYGDTNLDGKKWSEISPEYKRKFWDYVLVVDYIDNIEDDAVKNIFDRVNRNASRLTHQELRHAKYSGWFATEAESETAKSEWTKLGFSTTASAKRMKDIQFISELLLVILENKIVGFDQDYLDRKYAEYDIPSETHSEFVESNYTMKKDRVKEVILKMEDKNKSITRYAYTAVHFYTLWSIISIENKPYTNTLATKYVAFMEKVNQIREVADHPQTLYSGPTAAEYQKANEYYANSIGASTDFSKRKARFDVLKAILE